MKFSMKGALCAALVAAFVAASFFAGDHVGYMRGHDAGYFAGGKAAASTLTRQILSHDVAKECHFTRPDWSRSANFHASFGCGWVAYSIINDAVEAASQRWGFAGVDNANLRFSPDGTFTGGQGGAHGTYSLKGGVMVLSLVDGRSIRLTIHRNTYGEFPDAVCISDGFEKCSFFPRTSLPAQFAAAFKGAAK